MDWTEIACFVPALGVMLFGLVGCIIPVIPGVPIIWAAALVYGIATGFVDIGRDYLLIFGSLSVISVLLDWLVGVYGAKRLGASKWGLIGAFLGAIAGAIVATLPGLIAGPFIGAVLFELWAGKKSGAALKAGFGTFLGFIAGVAMKLGLGAAMIAVFVYLVVRPGSPP